MSNVALQLIETGNSVLDKIDLNGCTALIGAIYFKMHDVALKLIETNHSQPNQVANKTGDTALTLACYNKMHDIALKLIETGNSSPEHICYIRKNTALIITCMNSMTDVALKLIETGHSLPNQINNSGDTALILACSNNMSIVALKLIETGESLPNRIDKYGETALTLACNNMMSDVAIKLIETGESLPNYHNEFDETALILACNNRMMKVIKLLFNKPYENIIKNNKIIGHINSIDNYSYGKIIEQILLNSQNTSIYFANLINELIKNNYCSTVTQILNLMNLNVIIDLYLYPHNLHLTQFMENELKNKFIDKILCDKNKNTEKICSICMENVNVLNIILPCWHGLFCSACVFKLNEQQKCPQCRVNIIDHHVVYY